MTRAEFTSQHTQLVRRGKKALAWLGVPVVLATSLFMVWQTWYMRPIGLARKHGQSTIHRYGVPWLSAPSEQPLPSGKEVVLAELSALGIYSVVIAGSMWGMFHLLRSHAPKCEHCGRTIWANRGRQVLADGLCPFCRQPIFPP